MVVLKCVRKPLVHNFAGSSEAVVQTTTTLSCSRPGHLHLAPCHALAAAILAAICPIARCWRCRATLRP